MKALQDQEELQRVGLRTQSDVRRCLPYQLRCMAVCGFKRNEHIWLSRTPRALLGTLHARMGRKAVAHTLLSRMRHMCLQTINFQRS